MGGFRRVADLKASADSKIALLSTGVLIQEGLG